MHARSRTRHAFAPVACAAFALITLASAAHAQNAFIGVDTTLSASNPVAGSAAVGYTNQADLNSHVNSTSPTVSLVAGGSVGSDLDTFNSSTLNISGGSVGGFLIAVNSSRINVSGGSFAKDILAVDNSVVNISGGNGMFSCKGDNNGVFNIRGGSIGVQLSANSNSTINLFGTGLTALLVDPSTGGFSQYSLSGTLSDGTLLVNKTLYTQNGTGARFTLNNVAAVPETGSVTLLVGLTTAGANLLRRRRIRK